MKITKLAIVPAALSASLLLGASMLEAQDATGSSAPAPAPSTQNAPPPQGGPGGAGGAQGFLQQIMERRDATIKTALNASDDEWAVIQPLLDKVEQAQFAFMTTGNFGFGLGGRRGGNGANGGNAGGGGAGGAGGGGGNNPFQGSPEAQALNDAVQSGSTSNDDLKAKMAAVRAARKKAQDDLTAARENLQKVLSLHQEAVLLSMGVLD
jgi:hypothetical protein